jgi:hypothetical protein
VISGKRKCLEILPQDVELVPWQLSDREENIGAQVQNRWHAEEGGAATGMDLSWYMNKMWWSFFFHFLMLCWFVISGLDPHLLPCNRDPIDNVRDNSKKLLNSLSPLQGKVTHPRDRDKCKTSLFYPC